MAKKGDPSFRFYHPLQEKGTVLSTSATLDSPSIMSKFVSPPPHAASTKSVNMSDTFDDASTTFDEIGSISRFVESQITKATKQFGIEILITHYQDLSGLKERIPDDDYIELDVDL